MDNSLWKPGTAPVGGVFCPKWFQFPEFDAYNCCRNRGPLLPDTTTCGLQAVDGCELRGSELTDQ